MRLEVDISDLLELQNNLATIGKKESKQLHLKALRKAGEPIKETLNWWTPYRTGALLKDLSLRNSKFQEFDLHSVIVGYKGGTGHVGYIAWFLERGTKHIKARNFMLKAYQKNMQEAERIYEEEINNELSKVLK